MKQRKDFCKKVRAGKRIIPLTAFELNYSMCYFFKQRSRALPMEVVLDELKDFGRISIRKNPQSYEKRRAKKHPIRKKCFVCAGNAYYQHHIISLKKGGYDNGINRIPICGDCHKKLHSWL